MAFDNKEIAAFNLAMPYLTRVNAILNSNYTEFKRSDARAFLINLKQLFRELKPWLVVDKKKNIDERKDIKDAFMRLSKTPKSQTDSIWEQMEDIEDMMRLQFKARGMLMPRLADSRNLFGARQK